MNPLISVSVAFGIVALVLAWFLFDLRRKWRRVFGGRGQNREALGEVLERIVKAEQQLGRLEPRVSVLESIGNIAVQKVGFLRFNPFADIGGNQSFSVALLDREGNGLILSSLYTREGVRIYAKEVKKGGSPHPLSAEEQQVLAQAMKAG